jgi:Restriction endonuclease
MALMATLADRILDAIRYAPLDDDVLAKRLGVGHRQAVNQTARRLEAQGRLRRFTGPDGKIVNALPDSPVQQNSEPTPPPVVPGGGDHSRITEDEVKEAVRAHLTARGFDVAVAWGHVRGIDIDARHADGRRYVIEAKAEVGKTGAQQVNYFVGMLGELVQRMDDAQASYRIALPDNRQYRGLVDRLPALAKERLRLAVFWVSREGDELIVEVDS